MVSVLLDRCLFLRSVEPLEDDRRRSVSVVNLLDDEDDKFSVSLSLGITLSSSSSLCLEDVFFRVLDRLVLRRRWLVVLPVVLALVLVLVRLLLRLRP